jgi:Redoxin
MNKFRLYVDHILQGDFTPSKINLVFVFQVNCPGCFIYGFPQMNKLYEKYKENDFKVLGLATAFEDFELNNTKNVELLLTQQKTVGQTKAVIGGIFPEEIKFPIAVDSLMKGSYQMSSTFASNSLKGTPSYILCDGDFNIIHHWFGHLSDEKVIDYIEQSIA